MEYSGQSPNATLLILYSLPITAVTGHYLTDFRICALCVTVFGIYEDKYCGKYNLVWELTVYFIYGGQGNIGGVGPESELYYKTVPEICRCLLYGVYSITLLCFFFLKQN